MVIPSLYHCTVSVNHCTVSLTLSSANVPKPLTGLHSSARLSGASILAVVELAQTVSGSLNQQLSCRYAGCDHDRPEASDVTTNTDNCLARGHAGPGHGNVSGRCPRARRAAAGRYLLESFRKRAVHPSRDPMQDERAPHNLEQPRRPSGPTRPTRPTRSARPSRRARSARLDRRARPGRCKRRGGSPRSGRCKRRSGSPRSARPGRCKRRSGSSRSARPGGL
jgi:hypothetical protein